jgi:hypothetical protein
MLKKRLRFLIYPSMISLAPFQNQVPYNTKHQTRNNLLKKPETSIKVAEKLCVLDLYSFLKELFWIHIYRNF